MQMADPAFMRELTSWLRFSPRHAMGAGDGLFSVASGSPALPEWIGPRAFEMMVSAESENDRYASQLRSSSGVAAFWARAKTPNIGREWAAHLSALPCRRLRSA